MALTKRRPHAPAAIAERMGRRAGELLREYGIPSRCPVARDELARAWARGYMAGLDGSPRRGQRQP